MWRRWCINKNICLFLCVQFIRVVFTEVHLCKVVQYVHAFKYKVCFVCVCDLFIEFMFAHPKTRLKTNMIFNSHFTGSPIWDLFCQDAIRLENSWNVSFRIMYDLPVQTHRYLVEPVSEQIHLKKLLIKRFLSFLRQIEKSKKLAPKFLLNTILKDTRSVTRRNVRRILALTNKSKVEDITTNDIDNIVYEEMPEGNEWRIDLIKEVTDIKFGQLELDGFKHEECEEILKFACVS